MMIYKIINNVNGKLYIGKTEKSLSARWKLHLKHVKKGTNRYLYDAIRHYGVKNFSIEKIENVKSIDDLNKKERWWIKECQSKNKQFGYNMTDGGDGGKMLPSVYKRIADKKRGIPLTKEHRKKCSIALKGKNNPNFGKKMSAGQKFLISRTLKRKYKSGEWTPNVSEIIGKKGKNHPRYGKHHTRETKKLLSQMFMGWDRNTPENIETLRINSSGKNNWQYKNINKSKLLNVINKGLTTKEICDMLGICRWTLYSKCKSLFGISSIEKIRKNYE
jgi:group I intron endonuclease